MELGGLMELNKLNVEKFAEKKKLFGEKKEFERGNPSLRISWD